MVAEFTTQLGEQQQQLIDQLGLLPVEWALTPVKGNKACYRPSWQFESPLSHQQLIAEISSGKAKGYGLRTGSISGGIVAIDADGHAAHDKIIELSGEVPLPKTVAFTSNKPGRCQYLFYVPQEYWDAIATKKIGTGAFGDDGKEQKLELRWDGCQSVLPPSAHPETGCYRWRNSPSEIAIAPAPMWVVEQMLVEPEKVIDASLVDEHNIKHPDQIQLPVDAIIPLSACLTHRSRDMLILRAAAPDKGRNDSGIELARDLIGTANYLDSLGQRYDGNPENLFFDWCRACRLDTDKPKGQPKAIWKSASKGNSTPGSGRDGVDACIRGWHWRENIKPTGRGYSGGIGSGGGNRRGNGGRSGSGGGDGNEPPERGGKVVTHPAWTPLSPDELLKEISSLINQGLPDSEISLAIPNLAKRAGYTENATWKIYHERLKEVEDAENRAEVAALVDLMLKARLASVPLHSVLPLALAEPLAKYCRWLNIRPEVVLLTFLTTVSGLHHTATTCWLNKDWDFEVKPNLFTAIVAPPSQKKSPILKTIAKKPLRVLERQARDEWKKAIADYRTTEQHYNSLTKEQKEQEFPEGLPEPPPDRRKVYSFTDSTSEGLRNQIEAYPEQGLVALPDELARLIKSANKYRGGKGSDEEDLLSYYDGGGETALRADGLAGDFDNLLLAILGSIQPGVLQKMIKDCQDENGKWARFQFVVQPLAPSVMSADGGSFDLTPMLANLYERVNQLPPQDYKPDREAFAYYCSIYNEFERRRCSESHPGLSAAWGKAEGRIGKLACNLHVVHELMAGRTPSEFIPKVRYEEAFAIAMFSMQQVFSLYNELGDENALATHLTKVITLSQRKGEIVARDVQLLYDSKSRPTPDAVRSWFRELEAMNKGKTSGTGRTVSFTANVELVEPNVESHSTFESYINQGVQPNVEKVENCGVFSEKISCPDLTQNTVVSEIKKSEIFSTDSTSSTIASTVEEMSVQAVETSSTENSTNVWDSDSDDDPDPDPPGGGQLFPRTERPEFEAAECPSFAPAPAVNEAIAPTPAPPPTVDVTLSPAELEHWADALVDASEPEEVLEVADFHRSICGQNYDQCRQRVWAMLTPEQREKVTRLVKGQSPATEERTTNHPDVAKAELEAPLSEGGAVGRKARVLDLRGVPSTDEYEIVSWCEKNRLYQLSNGEKYYPFELRLD